MEYTKNDLEQRENYFSMRNKTRLFLGKTISLKALGYGILIFYAFISIWPFLWALFVSFKDPYLIVVTKLNPIPDVWTLENYTALFGENSSGYAQQWISNTIIYSTLSSLLNATLNLLGGYALAQLAMKGKKMIVYYFLASILIPSQATFVPTYFIYYKLGIINDDISSNMFIFIITFSGMANIILTFMARQFFLTQTPELEEASKIEGYSQTSIFFRITLMKMLPLFATQFVMVFMGSWNNFLAFQLFSGGDPEKMTLNTGIVTIAASAIDKETGYGQMLAMSNLSFIPMFFIYSISLRMQLRGIRGGNK